MIAILQFDTVNRWVFSSLLDQSRLPTLARLRRRGVWRELDTVATHFEGATYYTLDSGVPCDVLDADTSGLPGIPLWERPSRP